MAKRKYIDWDSIEPLYRIGKLSLNEICAQYASDHMNSQVWKTTVDHSAISKKAKEKGWTRNLAGQVKNRIKEKLITGVVTACDQSMSDDSIIESAAEAGAGVVVRHRKEIKEFLKHEKKLLERI